MAADDAADAAELSATLGHSFHRPDLLQEALSHPSLGGRVNYQRLEFLGDRVLGLIIAQCLYDRYPGLREGALARRLADLVRRETLAEVALAAGLDRAVRMARGTEDDGGRSKPAILADVCEAVIGALYLDGGMRAARQFIDRNWEGYLSDDRRGGRDAKSALQEWAQGRGLAAPVYREVARSGPDHAPVFVVEAAVAGQPPRRGEGASKRVAEMAAAEAVLKDIQGLKDTNE